MHNVDGIMQLLVFVAVAFVAYIGITAWAVWKLWPVSPGRAKIILVAAILLLVAFAIETDLIRLG